MLADEEDDELLDDDEELELLDDDDSCTGFTGQSCTTLLSVRWMLALDPVDAS